MLQRVWSDDYAGELTLWFFSKYDGKDLQPPCFQLWMKDDDGLLKKLMAKASLFFTCLLCVTLFKAFGALPMLVFRVRIEFVSIHRNDNR